MNNKAFGFLSLGIFVIILGIIVLYNYGPLKSPEASALSFTDLKDTDHFVLPNPTFLTASDNIQLAYYPMKVEKPIAALLFIHGGGAYSGAGYQYLAEGLNDKYHISVYLLDLRGHGNSEGQRGGAPSSEQVLNDVDLMIQLIREENPNVPIYLGGHSSGAGLILNYITRYNNPELNGYLFIAPQFGYKSMTDRDDITNPFVKVNTTLFVINAISNGKLFGNTPAVFFNYPQSVIQEKPLIIKSITVNMSLALTPDDPEEQFRDIDKPFGLFIGEQDELFEPQKVINYAEMPEIDIKDRSVSQIIKNQNHLSILMVADKLIGDTILRINRNH